MRNRRFPVGAELVEKGVNFRVWAQARTQVAVLCDGVEHPLSPEGDGMFSGTVTSAATGTRYRLRLDGGESFPDPASRFQPDGPHGDSVVIDPQAFSWQTSSWTTSSEPVIAEIHIGTFTPEGTWLAAIEKLPLLGDAGINTLEVMPVAEFPGRFGWGYDGVDLWAPSHLYGTPDDFRRFVDAAHHHGLQVILDVVYNHFGPDGCYLTQFSQDYFTKSYVNDWGDAINFDGPNARGVREFFEANAAYWIEEFALDGLRLDATQSIQDSSSPHILQRICRKARDAARGRPLYIVAENEPQDVRLVEELGIDALWNDDWHHAARVALGGRTEAYYTDYHGSPQEFLSMTKYGFLYQGQRYKWQRDRRGTPSLNLPADRFICFLENHDQTANSADGRRLSGTSSPARLRAMTALLLLSPQTPMLFQGQEFGSSRPFLYFADHQHELAAAVSGGRREFLRQFPSVTAIEHVLRAPDDEGTFLDCKLDWSERDRNGATLRLHRDLLALRKTLGWREMKLDGSVLSEGAFLLRWMTGGPDDRLLLVNIGRDLHLDPAPEPLLAPPEGRHWTTHWSSEWAEYGGSGTPEPDGDDNWRIPPDCAVLLRTIENRR
jgi:maltooligosyltrehalose trehalohydrolase